MTMKVAVGQAFSVEGREAVTKAIYAAKVDLGNTPESFALIVASHEYDFQAITSAALPALGDIPLMGFSTSGEITSEGSHRRSVVVALISDETLTCKSEWLPAFSDNSRHVTEELYKMLEIDRNKDGLVMVAADGLGGDYDRITELLPEGEFKFAGCLAGGDMRLGRTYQLGGSKSGAGGLAGAYLSSPTLRVGVGAAHGWRPVGAQFDITRVRGPWVRTLDSKPASERYASLFGRSAREWAFPPLNSLVRLYPLGIEQENGEMLVRTPLKVEADGSLRMSASLPDGVTGHLMVGSRDKCLEAARKAAGDALRALGGAEPKLALIFTDVSWEMLFQGFAGAEIEAVQEVFGKQVQLVGGYTFGQFSQLDPEAGAQFLNQSMVVVVLGEA